jgi:hypothetical protein
MKRALMTCLVLAIGTMPLTTSLAQSALETSLFVRVRVTTEDLPAPLIGMMLPYRTGQDSIRVAGPGGEIYTFPLSPQVLIERSNGRNRALWGIGAGSFGFLVGGALGADRAPTIDTFDGLARVVPDTFVPAFAGAAAGFAIGALIGSAVAPERWIYMSGTKQPTVTVSNQGTLVVSLHR